MSLSLFHRSEFNSAASAPPEPGSFLSVFELKRETIKKEKKKREAVEKMDFSCRGMQMLMLCGCFRTFFTRDLLSAALIEAVTCLHVVF